MKVSFEACFIRDMNTYINLQVFFSLKGRILTMNAKRLFVTIKGVKAGD